MAKCYNCGKEVDESVLICPECGALVKRYAAPERAEQTQDEKPAPYAAPVRQQAQPRAIVWRDEAGKLHLKGLVMAWIVICAVAAVYNAVSFACGLYLYHNQEAFLSLFAPYVGAAGQLGQMAELMRIMIAAIGQFQWVYVLLLVFYLAKGVGYIWFAAGKRKAALLVCFAASGATLVLMLGIGNGLSSVWYAADAVITWLLMRKSWKVLQ